MRKGIEAKAILFFVRVTAADMGEDICGALSEVGEEVETR